MSSTFGVVDRHLAPASHPPTWTRLPPLPTPTRTTGGKSLGTFLTEMLADGPLLSGRETYPALTDDWSRLIDLLLRVTKNKVFTDAQTLGKGKSYSRGIHVVSLIADENFVANSILGDRLPPLGGLPEVAIEDSPTGQSFVLLKLEPHV